VVEGYMDVVALAQHGIGYAVATLGTATTPIHAQKLFRLADSVVFCFDGDAAGRRAAWRALENTLPVLTDGKDASFLFLPEGEDPDDYVRKRGKAEFEALLGRATPLSEFLLAELAARHPPASAEGRAALVAAARPYLAGLGAPILSALLRRRLGELSGLPESELRALLPRGSGATPPPALTDDVRLPARPSAFARKGTRRAPSLTRELIQGLLLQPQLARTVALPRIDDGTAEGAALTALADLCLESEQVLTPAGIVQSFSGTPHEQVLVEALISAEDQGITAEQATEHLREGAARYWLQARRAGSPVAAAAEADTAARTTPEEAERLRQLDIVRRSAGTLPSARGNGS
jgi:DNA primase